MSGSCPSSESGYILAAPSLLRSRDQSYICKNCEPKIKQVSGDLMVIIYAQLVKLLCFCDGRTK